MINIKSNGSIQTSKKKMATKNQLNYQKNIISIDKTIVDVSIPKEIKSLMINILKRKKLLSIYLLSSFYITYYYFTKLKYLNASYPKKTQADTKNKIAITIKNLLLANPAILPLVFV